MDVAGWEEQAKHFPSIVIFLNTHPHLRFSGKLVDGRFPPTAGNDSYKFAAFSTAREKLRELPETVFFRDPENTFSVGKVFNIAISFGCILIARSLI